MILKAVVDPITMRERRIVMVAVTRIDINGTSVRFSTCDTRR